MAIHSALIAFIQTFGMSLRLGLVTPLKPYKVMMMCDHGEPRGARYCALCKRDGMSAKIDAITQVTEHADGTWWAASMRAINHLAKTRDTFTADDVLELVEAQGYRTKENRAMGGVMRHAQTKGIIEITDVFEPSHNKRKHASPTRVWRSLIVPAQMELASE
jgi:hypothetical protein